MPKIWNIQREEKTEGKDKRRTRRLRNERGREKVGMVNEVECWQRIISMTSKGVVISRCLSPSCHGLRVVSHPRVIVLIQAVPFRPDFPFTPRSPFCSASSLHLVLFPRPPSRCCRRRPSWSTTSGDKRSVSASRIMKRARSFPRQRRFLAAQLRAKRYQSVPKSKFVVDDPEIHESQIIDNNSAES